MFRYFYKKEFESGKNGKKPSKVFRIFASAFLVFAFFAAIFYLFVLPFLYATKKMDTSPLMFFFALFLFTQLWMLVIEYAYSSLAELYNLKRKYFFKFLFRTNKITSASGAKVFTFTLFSYFILIYGFTIIYLYLSNYYPSSFANSPLTFMEALYFSMIAGTVGFSDINPSSDLCRFFVMIEVFLGFLYTIVFFSLLGSYLRERKITLDKSQEEE